MQDRYEVIKKQVIIQILIVNAAFGIYGNIRLKEISILNWLEQIQENTNIRLGFFGSSAMAFIPDRHLVRESLMFSSH